MEKHSRARRRIALLISGFLVAGPLLAAAPTKPIRLIVPSAAGGTPDTLLRTLTAEITSATGLVFVIENKPGASGNIGMTDLMHATPDGLTACYVNNVTLAINRSTFKKLPYDPDRLTPAALLFKMANVITVNPSLPIRSFADLLAYAKANPNKLTYASPGQGTSGHLAGELLSQMANVSLRHVPYRGSPQAVTDVLGGQVDIMIDNTPTVLPYVKQGKLRALAVTSLNRVSQLPDVPTVAESGQPGFEAVAWGGLALPPGTATALARGINESFNKALTTAAVRGRFSDLGVDIFISQPSDLSDYARKETAKWAAVVKRAGIEPQ
jgi:tripartite-type tricarboxylate transporter receptor subunit TctC